MSLLNNLLVHTDGPLAALHQGFSHCFLLFILNLSLPIRSAQDLFFMRETMNSLIPQFLARRQLQFGYHLNVQSSRLFSRRDTGYNTCTSDNPEIGIVRPEQPCSEFIIILQKISIEKLTSNHENEFIASITKSTCSRSITGLIGMLITF